MSLNELRYHWLRPMSSGRLVHFLINFAFRPAKIWWKIAKTFASKFPKQKLMSDESARHRGKLNQCSQIWAIQVSCAHDGLVRILLKHSISSKKNFLRKKLERFQQNLVLLALLISFYTRFRKNQGSFPIFCDLSFEGIFCDPSPKGV